jgi:hypothetical protein
MARHHGANRQSCSIPMSRPLLSARVPVLNGVRNEGDGFA